MLKVLNTNGIKRCDPRNPEEDTKYQGVLKATDTVADIQRLSSADGKSPEFLVVFTAGGDFHLYGFPGRTLTPSPTPVPTPEAEVKRIETLTAVLRNSSSVGSSGVWWFIC